MRTGSNPCIEPMVDDELCIAIYPHGYVEWRGSRQALMQEALVPSTVGWPDAECDVEWSDERFDWWLRRVGEFDLPPAPRGCWALRRRAKEHRGDGFAAARRHQAHAERQDEAWQLTPAAQDQRRRFIEARLDDRFQYVKARLFDLFDLRR